MDAGVNGGHRPLTSESIRFNEILKTQKASIENRLFFVKVIALVSSSADVGHSRFHAAK